MMRGEKFSQWEIWESRWKKIGVDRGGNNDALENYLRDKARDAQTYPLPSPPSPRSTFHARDFFHRSDLESDGFESTNVLEQEKI